MTIAIQRREPKPAWPAFLRLLLSVMILAASATLLTGTIASLTATTINPESSFAAGALMLSDQVGVQKPCTSSGELVHCDGLFSSAAKPGSPMTALVTLQNVGTVPAGSFFLYSTNCTEQAGKNRSGSSASLCSTALLGVHDDSHDRCYYPAQESGPCRLTATSTVEEFARRYPKSSPMQLSADGIGTGIQFSLTFLVPETVDNSFQGRSAVVDFNWEIVSG